jgi:hypothetical protein
MTALYLYAITDQPEVTGPTGPGLEATSPLSLVYQDIAAVVSPVTAAEVLPTEANLWLHEAVVETLMLDRTVLPVRFGTVLAGEAAVQAVLAAHYADFVTSLNRVRGRVELGLRVLWISDFRLPIADCRLPNHKSEIENRKSKILSGRAYLLARLEEERQARAWRQRAEALADELHAPLAHLATENTRQVLITPRLLLTAAYLVERDRVTVFQREVEALQAAYPALHFLCTGPWPAYSFIGGDLPESSQLSGR